MRLGRGAAAIAVSALLAAQDPTAAAGARAPIVVEVVPSATVVWEQQTIEVAVRIAWEPSFLTERAVALFQRRLDLPFHVVVPWLQAAEGHAAEWLDAPPGSGPTVAVGDRVVVARSLSAQVVDGRTLAAAELRVRWTALVPGRPSLVPVTVRYAFATAFDEDLLRGRQPRDRQEATVASAPVALEVRALPREGRPDRWSGAVGEFALDVSLGAAEVAVGETVSAELTVRGTGNLQRFAPPPPPTVPGFVVQGMVERRTADLRRFVYDLLAVRPGLTELPPLEVPTFSPEAGAYRVLQSARVPLRTVPAADPAQLPERVRALVAADAAALAAAAALPVGVPVAAGAGAALLVLLLVVHRRRRARRQRRVQAAREVVAALARGADAAAEAFRAFCSEGTDGAWPQVAALRARGVPEALVQRLQVLDAALTAARFGGPLPAQADLAAAVEELAQRAR